jgi:leucine dehydrogenase
MTWPIICEKPAQRKKIWHAVAPMSVFDHPDFDDHEQVLYCRDESVGLQAIIAIHNTALGPAAGGCRMYPYVGEDDALTDVLRLSKGMTYKNAMAGLPLGGGKCVVIADPAKDDKPALLRALASHVQSLGGRYWTAIDVGVGPADIDLMAETCDYVFTRASEFPEGFDPSLYTALGGFTAIRAGAAHVWGREDLTGLSVAIQGVGATGHDLARQLHEAGADLVVADVRQEAVDAVVSQFDARSVDPAAIHAQGVDVFAPCAMGAVVDDRSLPQIKARLICGLANNQLAEPRHGEALRAAGIVYVPDYVANAGGMLGAGARIHGSPTADETRERILGIYDTTIEILRRADAEAVPSSDIADQIACERISSASRSPKE